MKVIAETKMRRTVAVAVVFAGLALAACAGPSQAQQYATDVTKAIVANNMQPVAPDFNAIIRPRLQNRAYVGHLSDELNALGTFQGVKEDTPSTAQSGYHHFEATFDKGTWEEDLTLDSDGKIAAFHVHPPATPGSGPGS